MARWHDQLIDNSYELLLELYENVLKDLNNIQEYKERVLHMIESLEEYIDNEQNE